MQKIYYLLGFFFYNFSGLIFAQQTTTSNNQEINKCYFEQTASFNQAAVKRKGKLDIVWVIDNSESMNGHQAKLNKAISAFTQKITSVDVDFNMAVISTDGLVTNSGIAPHNKLNSSQVVNAIFNKKSQAIFEEATFFKKTGSNLEKSFDSLMDFLKINPKFVRSDANLLIFFLSDIDSTEHSIATAAELSKFLLDIKGERKNTIFISGALSGDQIKRKKFDELSQYLNVRYSNLLKSSDFNLIMDGITGDVANFLPMKFDILLEKRIDNSNEMEVIVNGKPLSTFSNSNIEIFNMGKSYQQKATISFLPTSPFAQEINVSIKYRIACPEDLVGQNIDKTDKELILDYRAKKDMERKNRQEEIKIALKVQELLSLGEEIYNILPESVNISEIANVVEDLKKNTEDLLIIIDTSGSMYSIQSTAQKQLEKILKSLPLQTKINIVTETEKGVFKGFDGGKVSIADTNISTLVKKIYDVKNGVSAIGDALEYAARENYQQVLVISDGELSDLEKIKSVGQELSNKQIEVHTIQLINGSDKSEKRTSSSDHLYSNLITVQIAMGLYENGLVVNQILTSQGVELMTQRFNDLKLAGVPEGFDPVFQAYVLGQAESHDNLRQIEKKFQLAILENNQNIIRPLFIGESFGLAWISQMTKGNTCIVPFEKPFFYDYEQLRNKGQGGPLSSTDQIKLTDINKKKEKIKNEIAELLKEKFKTNE